MIRIAPADLLAVSCGCRYFYAVILSRMRLFGGNFSFVFHRTSPEMLGAEDVIRGSPDGFHAFVDFILAKREGRATRVARNVDVSPYVSPAFLKGTNTHTGKARLWFIYDLQFQEVKRTTTLSDIEKTYPLYTRIDDVRMVTLIEQRWTPEKDPRI